MIGFLWGIYTRYTVKERANSANIAWHPATDTGSTMEECHVKKRRRTEDFVGMGFVLSLDRV